MGILLLNEVNSFLRWKRSYTVIVLLIHLFFTQSFQLRHVMDKTNYSFAIVSDEFWWVFDSPEWLLCCLFFVPTAAWQCTSPEM